MFINYLKNMEKKITRGENSDKYIVEPYLLFNGNCENAFDFYKSIFGGEILHKVKYKDVPGEVEIPKSYENKIAYVSLPIGREIILMGSDSGMVDHVAVGTNVSLTLRVEDEEETRRLFKDLSDGGNVTMKLQSTFWAELYGVVTDRFGVNWMVNYVKSK